MRSRYRKGRMAEGADRREIGGAICEFNPQHESHAAQPRKQATRFLPLKQQQ